MATQNVILIAEDDDGHFELIKNGLQRAGITNPIIRFTSGEQVLDFLFLRGDGPKREEKREYILLLDIHMDDIDGVEVLKEIKHDRELRRIPVIMLTVIDDPETVEHCHKLGCSIYIVKPVEYDAFMEAVRRIGLFLSSVEVPEID